jgi:hydroxypyruvate isomerase
MKQSFCLPCFRTQGQSLQDIFSEAASIGYAATELWRPSFDSSDPESLENIWEAARTAGLQVSSFTGHDSIDHGLNDPTEWDRIESELERSLRVAAKLNIPGVICFAGTRRPGVSDAYGLALFTKGARRIVKLAEECAVNLNLEVLNSRIDHPNYMADTVDWAIAACEAVNSPRMKLLFDIYHVQIMEGDLVRGLRRAFPYIGHVHSAGNPGRHELDGFQEINYRVLASELVRLDYQGYLGHEFFARDDPMTSLRAAFEMCS